MRFDKGGRGLFLELKMPSRFERCVYNGSRFEYNILRDMNEFCEKTFLKLGDETYRVTCVTSSQTFTIKVSPEDIDAIMPLNLKSQYSRNNLRILIWAGRKSLSLSRYIMEGFDLREDLEKLYVRHINGDTTDFRRNNLAWSLSTSGRIITPENPNHQCSLGRKIVLKWKGMRLLFLEQEEADAALKKLEAGESPSMIIQTGRQRFTDWNHVAGDSSTDWAMWLRPRRQEISEIKEWLNQVRKPYPFEDEYLRRIITEGIKFIGTPECKLFAVGVAMWMDRKTQMESPLPEHARGRLKQINALVKRYSFRDPFEDFTEEYIRIYENYAYVQMPEVRASFSLTNEVE